MRRRPRLRAADAVRYSLRAGRSGMNTPRRRGCVSPDNPTGGDSMRKGIALFGFLGVAGLMAAFVSAPAQDKPKKERPEIEVPYVPTPQKVVDAMLKLA